MWVNLIIAAETYWYTSQVNSYATGRLINPGASWIKK